jgi:hypothetical protein
VLKHHWHRGNLGGNGGGLRELIGPDQQIEREPELRQRAIALAPGGVAEQICSRNVRRVEVGSNQASCRTPRVSV